MIDPQFGIHTREKLKAARTAAGGSLQWPEVDRIIQECHEAHEKLFNAGATPPKKKRAISMVGICDEEWIAQLEQEPAYQGIDIKRELGKCQVWMKLRSRIATRRTFINWLNKAEKTIGYSGEGRSSASVNPLNPYIEPENWRSRAAQAYPDLDFTGREWGDLGIQTRTEILRKSS